MFTIDQGKSKNAHKAAIKKVTGWINDVLQPIRPLTDESKDKPLSGPPFAPRPPSYPPPPYLIMVSEIQCNEPDCVPIETLVVVMENDPTEPFDAVALAASQQTTSSSHANNKTKSKRWIEKILKPVTEVTLRDVFQLDVLLELGTDDMDQHGLSIGPLSSDIIIADTSTTISKTESDETARQGISNLNASGGTSVSLARLKVDIMSYIMQSDDKKPADTVNSLGFGYDNILRFNDVIKLVTDLKTDALNAFASVNNSSVTPSPPVVAGTMPAPTVVPMKLKTSVISAPASVLASGSDTSDTVVVVNYPATISTPPTGLPIPVPVSESIVGSELVPPPPPTSSSIFNAGAVATTVVPMKASSSAVVTAAPGIVLSMNQNKGKAGLPGLSGTSRAIPPTRHKKGQRPRGCPCCDPDNIDNVVDLMFLSNA